MRPQVRSLQILRHLKMSAAGPKIRRIGALDPSEAKWTELRKIEWTDQDGKDRVWEAAARKTRGKGGVDAVAIAPILRHPSRPPQTMVILQYRPPVEAFCVEFPAGLIDEGETPEQAAVRELKEETGYEGKVLDCSPTIVSDPGLTNANMQIATIEVELKEGDKEPEQHLDEGEHIERILVPLDELYDKLQAMSKDQGKIVDARLFHWAAGLHWARRLGLKG
ncbi:putative Nudix hydrolase P35G2.12 [Pseudocercospora fuligena]|uniref:Putative Nudix hydrolase P35G2.12 n=1 Tax=Pseudocercospora fuligena TaxID=685502 RepID=A0A8H6RF84_9PEZI|nr:putative Nudix hydrolase P35G2.12 [Pseudocercospora fuligena]